MNESDDKNLKNYMNLSIAIIIMCVFMFVSLLLVQNFYRPRVQGYICIDILFTTMSVNFKSFLLFAMAISVSICVAWKILMSKANHHKFSWRSGNESDMNINNIIYIALRMAESYAICAATIILVGNLSFFIYEDPYGLTGLIIGLAVVLRYPKVDLLPKPRILSD